MRLCIGIAILLAGALGACRRAAESDTRPLIFVVTKGSSDQFWLTVRAGASDAANDKGVFLEWPSTFRENELAGQARVLRAALADARRQGRRMALVLASLAGQDYRETLYTWVKNGLALVALDEDVRSRSVGSATRGSSPDSGFVSFVGTHNKSAGFAAGEYLAAKLGKTGKIAVLRLNPISNSTTLRERGFLDAIMQYPGIQVVDDSYYYAVNLDVESAYRESRRLLDDLQEEGIHLDGLFCPNESTTTGMLLALEDRNLAGRIALVGFDRTGLLVNALHKRQITALVVQDPYEMGKKSVERAVELLGMTPAELQRRISEEAFDPTYTPFVLVDHEQLEKCRGSQGLPRAEVVKSNCDPDVLRLLYPKSAILHLQSPGSAR